MAEHTIFDVAKWFTDKNGGEIGSKKLQKLCYYAQAWSYAIRDKAMFKGKFQAWVHGPVNKKLWNTFKDIAYRDITSKDFDDRSIELNVMTKKEKEFLERVWATYGEFSGYQLEELTHQEKPWLKQRKGLHPYESSTNIITRKSMEEYYREILSQGRNT